MLGSYLLPKLIRKNYTVFALTRSAQKISKINQLGAQGIVGNIRMPGTFTDSVRDLDLIILLAMPGIKPGKRVTRKRFRELRQETNDFFNNSMNLARRFDIPVIFPSGTSFHTKDNEIADETWPIKRIGLTRIGSDTDEIVNTAIKSNNPGVIQLVYGKIYGNGGLFRMIYEMMKKGRFRIVGQGNNYIPNIHADDAAEAIIKAIEKMPVGEKFIIADDCPVTQKDFTLYMADLMKIKRPGRIPGFVVRTVIGKDFYEIIKMNCIVSNEKAKSLLGWDLKYPSYIEGLEAAISEMEEKLPCFA